MPPKKTASIRSVDDYIRTQPLALQTVLERVRRIVRRALPGAQEVLSYRIPAYRLNGRIVIFFAGWKEHYSIYPAGERSVWSAFQKELASCEIAIGTIRFPLDRPIPTKLITAIAKFRAGRVKGTSKSTSKKQFGGRQRNS